jgi:FKBP-type peptidyl-prolyl cis-trans isomerase (trigger factor)
MSFKRKKAAPTKGEIVKNQGNKLQEIDAITKGLNQGLVQTMQHLNQLQQEMGTLAVLATRFNTSITVATDKDYVTIDCLGRLYNEDGSLGEAFEGGTLYGYAVDCSAPEAMIPKFVENLVGKGSGANFSFDVEFPEEYQAPQLANKKANFEVTVLKVFTPVANMQTIRNKVKSLTEESKNANAEEAPEAEKSV